MISRSFTNTVRLSFPQTISNCPVNVLHPFFLSQHKIVSTSTPHHHSFRNPGQWIWCVNIETGSTQTQTIPDARDYHYPVCQLDIRQDNKFATGYGHPKTAFKLEPDADIRYGFIYISRVRAFGKSCTLHNHSFIIFRRALYNCAVGLDILKFQQTSLFYSASHLNSGVVGALFWRG